MPFMNFHKGGLLAAVSFLLLPSSNLQAQTEVKLNEIFANNNSVVFTDDIVADWVELYNTSGAPVDLGNASLTDDNTVPRRWVFPAGVTIPANGYLTILLDSELPVSTNSTGPLNAGFALSGGGESIYFFGRAGTPLIDSLAFGLQAGDLTLGRVPSGTGAWVLGTPTPNQANTTQQLGPATGLRINEWMASPSDGDDWFEIYNSGTLPVALNGLFLTDDPADKRLSPIPPLSFIGTGLNGYTEFIADDDIENGPDHVAFGLRAGGEPLAIFDSAGVQIDLVTFGQQTADVSQGRLPDGSGNLVSFPSSASPGGPNFVQFPGLVINEVLSHTDPPYEDAVEIYNQTDAAINIGGWWLSNNRTDLQRFQIPAGTTVPARGYVVFYEGQFNGATAQRPFNFSSAYDDQVYLAQSVNGQLTGSRIGESFEPAENNVSFGRYETTVPGDYKFVAMNRPTFGVDNPTSVEQFRTGQGAVNSGPQVGPVVINEIMYNPRSLDGISDNIIDEYIELRNITSEAVPLYDPAHPENRWRLRDAIRYSFPTGTTIPAFGYVLVVSFDPVVNTAQANTFRTRFNVPAQVPLFGPYTAVLGNNGDSVELYKPDPPQAPGRPDAGFVPFIRADKLNYGDAAPWPTAADGTGASLQRKNSTTFGNDPVNWEATAPTAGRANSQDVVDDDGDGLPNQWEQQYGFPINDASNGTADPDGDGMNNLAEYVAGTDPTSAGSLLEVMELTAPPSTNLPVSLSFTAVAEKSYSVQFRNSLQPSTVWQTVEDVGPFPTTREAEVVDTGSTNRAQRFYRIITPAAD